MLRVTLTPVTVPSATTAPSKSLPAGRKVDGGMIDGFRYSLGLLISFSFFFFFLIVAFYHFTHGLQGLLWRKSLKYLKQINK